MKIMVAKIMEYNFVFKIFLITGCNLLVSMYVIAKLLLVARNDN